MTKENKVTINGNPLLLLGPELKIGDMAPNFRVVDEAFKQVALSSFKGKKILISVVPSVDTGVCALQTKRFNEEASKISGVLFITISTDLPFAQKRFCDTEKIETMKLLCDSVWHDFGEKYGVLVDGMGLLARSIFVISPEGKITYAQIVGEITEHPDYNAALAALKAL